MMLLCFSGAALGIVWAALPGLSTTMAMALLVGLTYNMPAEPAIIFILGTFTGAVFGGHVVGQPDQKGHGHGGRKARQGGPDDPKGRTAETEQQHRWLKSSKKRIHDTYR